MKYTPHKNFNINRYTYVRKRARLYHTRLNNRHAYDSVGWRELFQTCWHLLSSMNEREEGYF